MCNALLLALELILCSDYKSTTHRQSMPYFNVTFRVILTENYCQCALNKKLFSYFRVICLNERLHSVVFLGFLVCITLSSVPIFYVYMLPGCPPILPPFYQILHSLFILKLLTHLLLIVLHPNFEAAAFGNFSFLKPMTSSLNFHHRILVAIWKINAFNKSDL